MPGVLKDYIGLCGPNCKPYENHKHAGCIEFKWKHDIIHPINGAHKCGMDNVCKIPQKYSICLLIIQVAYTIYSDILLF